MLDQSGEVTVSGNIFPVFQCDDCVSVEPIFGEPFEVVYTFAVDAAGTPFDPAAAEEGDSLN